MVMPHSSKFSPHLMKQVFFFFIQLITNSCNTQPLAEPDLLLRLSLICILLKSCFQPFLG